MCAEPPSPNTGGSNDVKVIAPIAVAIGVATALAAVAGYLIWRSQRKEPVSTALSRSALLKLTSSTKQDLEFEFQKDGSPVLIGKGGFGEVAPASFLSLPCCLDMFFYSVMMQCSSLSDCKADSTQVPHAVCHCRCIRHAIMDRLLRSRLC